MTKTISKNDYKDISLNHLYFCLSNQNLFTNEYFSIIQYSNPIILDRYFSTARQIYNEVARTPRTNTYLNFGMGAGFLEYYVKNYGKINMESVEWDQQNEHFSILRKSFDVDDQLTYICNDIRNDDFKIFDCDKTYDFIILTRFYPINKKYSDTLKAEEILNKLKKYSNKFIILDNPINYRSETLEYFESKKYNKLQFNHTDLNPWVIEL
jgi:hypothetical protein